MMTFYMQKVHHGCKLELEWVAVATILILLDVQLKLIHSIYHLYVYILKIIDWISKIT